MTAKKRFLTVLSVGIFLFTVLFSACYIAAESDHDCSGEDCPICLQINTCENILRNVSGTVLFIILFAHMGIPSVSTFFSAANQKKTFSLVTLKVKLSD